MPWARPSAPQRRRCGAAALATGLMAVAVGVAVPAHAVDGATAITAATPTTFPVVSARQDSDGTLTLLDHPSVHVTGTAAGRDHVDIGCTTATTVHVLAAGTPVTSGAFAADVDPTAAAGIPCTLRALPAGTPAGSSSTTWTATSFHGVPLSAALDLTRTYARGPAAGRWYDYEEFDPIAGRTDYEVTSAGGTAIARAALATGPDTIGASAWAGAARYPLDINDGSGGLHVDGSPALLAAQAGRNSGADAPGLLYTGERAAADGALSLHETEPVLRCGAAGANPTANGCVSYEQAGVAFDRTWRVEPAGDQVVVTDTFTGTDVASHAITVTIEDDVPTVDGPVIDAGSGLHALAAGQAWSPAAGAGSYLVRESGAVADAAHPVATVTWSLAPSVVRVTAGDGVLRVLSDTKRVLAPEASLTITRTYSIAAAEPAARALTAGAEDALRPRVAIDALPTHVASRRLVVTGSVSAGGNGLPSAVTVHGVRAAVRPDGRFRLTTRLRPGRTMLRWSAVDPGGLAGSGDGRVVTFASPISAGKAHRARGQVFLPLRCAAWVGAGHRCVGSVRAGAVARTVRIAAGRARTVRFAAASGPLRVALTYLDPAGGTIRVTQQTLR